MGGPPQGQPPGQPPAPPTPEMAKLQAIVAKPSWTEILSELKDNASRSYLIDIETNSTLDADATEDKQDLNELLGAIGNTVQGFAPMMEAGMPMSVLKGMLLGVVGRYRFSEEVIEYIRMMPDQMPQQGDQKQKEEVEAIKAKAQAETQSAQMKMAMEREEMQLKKEELQFKREEQKLKHEMAMEKLQMQRMQGQEKARLDQQKAANAANVEAVKANAAMVTASQPPMPAGGGGANV